MWTYKIEGDDIEYNFERLNTLHGGPFFDTGTTFLYLPSDLMSQFTKQFSAHCTKSVDNCASQKKYKECYLWDKTKYPVLNDFLASFPVITFYFNENVPYKWYPQDYLVQPLDSALHYCIGVKSLSHTILGALFMRNYDIFFDRTEKRIGFRRANCGSDPYFIDDLKTKPKDKPKDGTFDTDKIVMVSAIRANNDDKVDIMAKGDSSSYEHDDNGFYVFLISLVLMVCLLGCVLLLRFLYRYNKKRREIKEEIDSNTPVQLEENVA